LQGDKKRETLVVNNEDIEITCPKRGAKGYQRPRKKRNNCLEEGNGRLRKKERGKRNWGKKGAKKKEKEKRGNSTKNNNGGKEGWS